MPLPGESSISVAMPRAKPRVTICSANTCDFERWQGVGVHVKGVCILRQRVLATVRCHASALAICKAGYHACTTWYAACAPYARRVLEHACCGFILTCEENASWQQAEPWRPSCGRPAVAPRPVREVLPNACHGMQVTSALRLRTGAQHSDEDMLMG